MLFYATSNKRGRVQVTLLNYNTEEKQSTVLGVYFRLFGELFYNFNTMNPQDEDMPLRRFAKYFPALQRFAIESDLKDLQYSLQNLYTNTEKILENKVLWEKSQREYQTLFLAPDLPVPLWESLHLSNQKTLFTEETTAVREWYRRFGLDISAVGYEAEDHIAFEFFFCGWLFDKAVLSPDEELTENKTSLDDLDQFIHEHLGLWGIQCLSSLKAHSSDPFWLAVFIASGNLLEIMTQDA